MSASSTAYLLIAHGSRDSRPQAAMNRLAQLVRDQLRPSPNHAHGLEPNPIDTALKPAPNPFLATTLPPQAARAAMASRADGTLALTREGSQPYPIVGTAYLEAAPLPLHQQICEFCLRVKATGVEQVKIVPIFLLRGVHVMEDIPQELALAREQLAGQMRIELTPHLGSHPGLGQLLKTKMAATASTFWLVLAHGSRQPGGNRSVEALAESLGATAAFWAMPPNLETQVVKLIQAGGQRLTILPYFLFTGSTTDAIIRVTEELAERFPKVEFRLLPPLGATQEIAQLTAELTLEQPRSGAGAVIKPMKRIAWRC